MVLLSSKLSSVLYISIFHKEILQILEAATVIQILVLRGRKVAINPPQTGKKLGNLNLDRLLTSRLPKCEWKGQCVKNTAYHPSSPGMRNTGAHWNAHGTNIKLQPNIQQLHTEGADHRFLTFHFGDKFRVQEPALKRAPGCKEGSCQISREGKEAWKSSGLPPARSPRAAPFVG